MSLCYCILKAPFHCHELKSELMTMHCGYKSRYAPGRKLSELITVYLTFIESESNIRVTSNFVLFVIESESNQPLYDLSKESYEL